MLFAKCRNLTKNGAFRPTSWRWMLNIYFSRWVCFSSDSKYNFLRSVRARVVCWYGLVKFTGLLISGLGKPQRNSRTEQINMKQRRNYSDGFFFIKPHVCRVVQDVQDPKWILLQYLLAMLSTDAKQHWASYCSLLWSNVLTTMVWKYLTITFALGLWMFWTHSSNAYNFLFIALLAILSMFWTHSSNAYNFLFIALLAILSISP